PTLTGRQNAKFVCRVHGHQADLADRLAFVQDFSELGGFFDQPVYTYSSRMRARLQLAMSLAFDFDVYISDEVTAAGDAAFRKKAADALKFMAHRSGLILVVHGESTLKEFCDAGIWINDGRPHWFDTLDVALSGYKE